MNDTLLKSLKTGEWFYVHKRSDSEKRFTDYVSEEFKKMKSQKIKIVYLSGKTKELQLKYSDMIELQKTVSEISNLIGVDKVELIFS